MLSVGIKQLKNKLSAYVRLAASGEVILVTDRERVVAELVPPREGRAVAVDDAALAELLRTGLVQPPVLRPAGPPPRIPVAPTEELLREIESDRADR